MSANSRWCGRAGSAAPIFEFMPGRPASRPWQKVAEYCAWLAQATADPISNPRITVLPPNKHVDLTACKLRLYVEVRKAILMMLLAVVSSGAQAAWVAVDSNETGTVYADPATIRKAGNKVTMRYLLDNKTVRKTETYIKPYMSMSAQAEYDCRAKQRRVLDIAFHSGNMAGGEIVESLSDPDKWEIILPGSVVDYLWQFACEKR